MSFNSFIFWVVFPFIFAIYWIISDKAIWGEQDSLKSIRFRNVFLLIISYLLYANWKPAYTLILLAITLLTYFGALYIEEKDEHCKRGIIFTFSILTLVSLLSFKYYNFVNGSVWNLLSSVGLRYELHGLNWAIPVGISFYTFQALGYLFDVYYRKEKAEKSFVDYALFVSFFPQVFSGPISKASELLPQIKEKHKFKYEQGVQGLKFLLWGMFLKLVLADRLGLYVDKVVESYSRYDGPTCVMSAIFYSLQIYGDFAGYSLVAVGVAKLMGFDLIINFKRPYFSVSITDFWRRWHISLFRWLKDYVYIPMGGSRCSKLHNYWNIFVTFLVSGIWHGANWTYIVWGIIHGVAQIIEKALGLNIKEANGIWRFARIVVTFAIVTLAWVFFRMPTLGDAVQYLEHSFSSFGIPKVLSVTNFTIYVLAIVIVLFKESREEFFPTMFRFLNNHYVRWAEYIVIFCLILLCGALDSGSFIYGSF